MFHLETRTFKIYKINDTVWGVAPPVCVSNKYQVLIAISQSYDSTVDSTVEEDVYYAVGNENAFRILCTLYLAIPMKMEGDLINLPNPSVVFSATEFMTSYDWHCQEETVI